MEILNPKELSLKDLKREIKNVKLATAETQKFINTLDSISEDKLKQIQELKENLELIKKMEKRESKENHLAILKERTLNLKKAVEDITNNNKNFYDPRRVKWTSN